LKHKIVTLTLRKILRCNAMELVSVLSNYELNVHRLSVLLRYEMSRETLLPSQLCRSMVPTAHTRYRSVPTVISSQFEMLIGLNTLDYHLSGLKAHPARARASGSLN
jgi:hypothetical protein